MVFIRFLLLLCILPCCLFGQEESSLTAAEKDSIRYTRLKEKFYRRKITKSIYQLFFNDVYNRKKSSGEVVNIDANPFDEYAGLTIRKIDIRQLNMLGESVHDTNRVSNRFQTFVSTKLQPAGHKEIDAVVFRRRYCRSRTVQG